MARSQRRSAGIVLHRDGAGGPEVLLVHPGGPFWAKKDLGAWSIPKGEYEPDEDPRARALREFEEETGSRLDAAELVELGTVVQKAGKEVSAWAVRGSRGVGSHVMWHTWNGLLLYVLLLGAIRHGAPRQARSIAPAGQSAA